MTRRSHIVEEKPWWPDALLRLQELANAGETRHGASSIAAKEFEAGLSTFRDAMERGSVPAFPTKSPTRAAAWAEGERCFEGKPCKNHCTRTRFVNDGTCVQCVADYAEANKRKQREKVASRDAE